MAWGQSHVGGYTVFRGHVLDQHKRIADSHVRTITVSGNRVRVNRAVHVSNLDLFNPPQAQIK